MLGDKLGSDVKTEGSLEKMIPVFVSALKCLEGFFSWFILHFEDASVYAVYLPTLDARVL